MKPMKENTIVCLQRTIDLDAEMFEAPSTDPYEGFLHRTLDEAVAIAKTKGCVVRTPAPNELFIDLDSEAAYKTFNQQCNAAPKYLLLNKLLTPSPSGEPYHYHVVLQLSRPVRDERERILLQALFGSDLMRELLSWRRLEDGTDPGAISLFFEKPVVVEETKPQECVQEKVPWHP